MRETIETESTDEQREVESLLDLIYVARWALVQHHDIVDGGGAGEHPTQLPNWAMRATDLLDEIVALIPDAVPITDQCSLAEALETIAGGFISGPSTDAIIAGDWHPAFTELQSIAKLALPKARTPQASTE